MQVLSHGWALDSTFHVVYAERLNDCGVELARVQRRNGEGNRGLSVCVGRALRVVIGDADCTRYCHIPVLGCFLTEDTKIVRLAQYKVATASLVGDKWWQRPAHSDYWGVSAQRRLHELITSENKAGIAYSVLDYSDVRWADERDY